MTDNQQRKIEKAIIGQYETLLSQIKHTNLSGEDQVQKLKEIKNVIDEVIAVREMPLEWMQYFGPNGLRSQTTVLSCGWFRLDMGYVLRPEGVLLPKTRRVFKNFERGKHAEIEMLEWLKDGNVPKNANELRIVISRSPCKVCLNKIIHFKKSLLLRDVKFRIGFANWYRKDQDNCSDALQMYDSIENGIEYLLLTKTDIECGVMSSLFERNNKKVLVSISPDWITTFEHGLKNCYDYERSKAKIPLTCCKSNTTLCEKCKRAQRRATEVMLKVFDDRLRDYWVEKKIEKNNTKTVKKAAKVKGGNDVRTDSLQQAFSMLTVSRGQQTSKK